MNHCIGVRQEQRRTGFRWLASKIDQDEVCAVLEGVGANVGNAGWDVNVDNAGTTIKGILPDAGDTVGKGHFGQASAAVKRIVLDRFNVGDCYAGQTRAAEERVRPDVRNAKGNGNTNEVDAVPKSKVPNVQQAIRHFHADEVGATIKRAFANISQADRNRNTSQTDTSCECTIS